MGLWFEWSLDWVGTIGWDESICMVYPLDVNVILFTISLCSITEKLFENGSRILLSSLYTNSRRNLRFSPYYMSVDVCGNVIALVNSNKTNQLHKETYLDTLHSWYTVELGLHV